MVTSIKQELQQTGTVVFTNKGNSMRPLLRQDRDLMIIETLKEPPKRYDAVLFERPDGRLILHRILRIRKDGVYWIVGDNCPSGELIPPDAVLGILTGIKRGRHRIRVDSFGYRLYVYLWCAPYPIRIALQFVFRLPFRCVRKFLRMVKKG